MLNQILFQKELLKWIVVVYLAYTYLNKLNIINKCIFGGIIIRLAHVINVWYNRQNGSTWSYGHYYKSGIFRENNCNYDGLLRK